jgi:hypothetical protein
MTHDEAHKLLIRLVALHAAATARHMAGDRGDLFGDYASLHCDLVDLLAESNHVPSTEQSHEGVRNDRV